MPRLAASSRLRLLPKAQSLRMRMRHTHSNIWRSLLIRHELTKFATMMDVLESTLPESATATTLNAVRMGDNHPC
jgi:hypothetical protein